jgi:hypothetical protein
MSRNLDSFLPKSEMTPFDVGLPLLWMDAADSSQRFLNGNNEVIGFFNKGFAGNYFAQSTPGAASHPSIKMLGNKAAFQTTNINGFKGLAVPMPLSEITMFFVYDDNAGTILESENASLIVSDAAITVGSATGAAHAKLGDDDPHILMVHWNAANGELWYKFDEDDSALLDTNTTRLSAATDDIYLMNTDGQDDGTIGAVGEIIVYGTKLPTFQMNRVGKYLCTKWNGLWSDV